jgi:UDP-hydrolysing UDP-N-acetyl-D-glucosamine 2-epimerase
MKDTKICIVTSARSEYGHLKWIIDQIHNDPELELQLVVTGGHLSNEQGYTIKDIEEDGYPIAAKVDMKLNNLTTASIVRSTAYCSRGMADVFEQLKPNILLVLGDRYELLSICSAALIMEIPIAHLSGGDVTEGAIDNAIRNAITMMASIHFPGVQDSANNIARMKDSSTNIYVVGEPSLEFFNRIPLMTRIELAKDLYLDSEKKWVMLTYHPETKISLEDNLQAIRNIINVLEDTTNTQVVISKANADYGGMQINEYLTQVSVRNPHKFKLFASLGQLRYLSYMKQVQYVIGNSSSGIVETPFLFTPTINIGNRQKGRYLCENIIQIPATLQDIQKEIVSTEKEIRKSKEDSLYWGDGNTASKVIDILKKHEITHKL